MARDFDFRPTSKPAKAVNTVKAPAPKRSKTNTPGKKTGWPFALLAIGLGLASVAVFVQYNNQISSTTPVPETAATDGSANAGTTNQSSAAPATDSNSNAFSNNPGLLTVQVYESGGGEQAYGSLIEQLKAAGYEVQPLGQSQFQYDKTYIWYRSKYRSVAQEVGEILKGRELGYKESQIEGVFDVLIYVGKQ